MKCKFSEAQGEWVNVLDGPSCEFEVSDLCEPSFLVSFTAWGRWCKSAAFLSDIERGNKHLTRQFQVVDLDVLQTRPK